MCLLCVRVHVCVCHIDGRVSRVNHEAGIKKSKKAERLIKFSSNTTYRLQGRIYGERIKGIRKLEIEGEKVR